MDEEVSVRLVLSSGEPPTDNISMVLAIVASSTPAHVSIRGQTRMQGPADGKLRVARLSLRDQVVS